MGRKKKLPNFPNFPTTQAEHAEPLLGPQAEDTSIATNASNPPPETVLGMVLGTLTVLTLILVLLVLLRRQHRAMAPVMEEPEATKVAVMISLPSSEGALPCNSSQEGPMDLLDEMQGSRMFIRQEENAGVKEVMDKPDN